MNILLIIGLIITNNVFSQSENKFIREGNKLYNQQKYQQAEVAYRKALAKKSESFKAAFNTGDALYKQGKYEDAIKQFEALIPLADTKEDLARLYHNIGNAQMQLKKYKESINAYKDALRNYPSDEETKYNLAYAQRMLVQQQQQPQQNQDKKDENKKEDKQQQQPKQNENKQQHNQQEMKKEEAQPMLKALEDKEKQLQEKLKKQPQGQKIKLEKDW